MPDNIDVNEAETKKAMPFIAMYIFIVMGLFVLFAGLILLMTGVVAF